MAAGTGTGAAAGTGAAGTGRGLASEAEPGDRKGVTAGLKVKAPFGTSLVSLTATLGSTSGRASSVFGCPSTGGSENTKPLGLKLEVVTDEGEEAPAACAAGCGILGGAGWNTGASARKGTGVLVMVDGKALSRLIAAATGRNQRCT